MLDADNEIENGGTRELKIESTEALPATQGALWPRREVQYVQVELGQGSVVSVKGQLSEYSGTDTHKRIFTRSLPLIFCVCVCLCLWCVCIYVCVN